MQSKNTSLDRPSIEEIVARARSFRDELAELAGGG